MASGSGTSSLSGITVGTGDAFVCTITNTRKTGTIEVIKNLDPTTDPGKFNLQVDGTTKKTDAGNGGTTGAVTVNTGSNHSVGETAGTGTSLATTRPSIACTRNGNAPIPARGTSLSRHRRSQPVRRRRCTITNTRKAGTIEVIKSLSPTTDPGKFNLQVDGTTKKTDAGNGGTTGAVTVNTGNHSVGETAGTGTSSRTTRRRSRCTRTVTRPGSGTEPRAASRSASGDRVVCTITNTRNTGTIEVIKRLSRPPIRASSTCRSTARPRRPRQNVDSSAVAD